MDCYYQDNEKENSNKRNSNSQYLPIKCRTTRPPPPLPATNPLQFVKVAPPPLIQKAQEQVKKVEQVKSIKQDLKEDGEDWQQNLDNWKSSRRKRQEHIIERVVEVKKITQEEHDKVRRKSKTFNEILEERSKRGHRLKLPIYEDEDSDFGNFGVGNKNESKTDTEVQKEESKSPKGNRDSYEFNNLTKEENVLQKPYSSRSSENIFLNDKKPNDVINSFTNNQLNFNCDNAKKESSELSLNDKFSSSNTKLTKIDQEINNLDNVQQYTYESAIEGYRSRIKSKIKIDESFFNKPTEYKPTTKVDVPIPKGALFRKKEIFEAEKPVAIGHLESLTSKRLSEDFVNSQSIKERLKSLEKCVEQPLIRTAEREKEKERDSVPVKWAHNVSDENGNKIDKKSNLNVYKSNIESTSKHEIERSFSPETEMYVSKLNVFSKDLDDLLEKNSNQIFCTENEIKRESFCDSSNDALGVVSSDREDSGINTTDVSCSVSQADESTNEDGDLHSPIVVAHLEKDVIRKVTEPENNDKPVQDDKHIIKETKDLLEQLQIDAANNFQQEKKWKSQLKITDSDIDSPIIKQDLVNEAKNITEPVNPPLIVDYIDELELSNSPLAPAKAVEPPKEKPPPPPPQMIEQEKYADNHSAIINSTKRLKKEIHVKRSSFLGLDEPTEDLIDPDLAIEKPPDINRFLQEESQMEKCLYKKLHGSREMISEVESQDSGLESERGRLSSDTWCSHGTSAHFRQDSEQTNSVTSEEDEVTRKEREIIELVEKEEKSKSVDKDNLDSHHYSNCLRRNFPLCNDYFPVDPSTCSTYCSSALSDTDLEVMRVEQELNQLERKHVESENYLLPCESSSKNFRQINPCRKSMENICDAENCSYPAENYRKSLPDLYHDYKSPPSACSYRKSMPDINQTPYLSFKKHENNVALYPLEYRKSMPELEANFPRQVPSSTLLQKAAYPSNWGSNVTRKDKPAFPSAKLKQPVSFPSKNGVHALSAVPKQKHIPNDVWIQPKAKPETRSYNQHWLLQEAELRRIEEHKKNLSLQGHLKWQLPSRQEQHIPDPIIETLTQRIQNRTSENQRRQFTRRSQPPVGNKDCNRYVYLSHDNNLNQGISNTYSSPLHLQESQNQLLSVSGKKKCSFCGSELGRGAAMIIESLALFYHMECFKCCVCHVQLGDGLMGTDVRVRNQKLHCHNCYSSDDGVKFSCV